ncbi:MAG: hypothetical protein KQ78_01572 [Candidatus Izimaplasma bacterium HR2]|nr:MAG: hypothetical protein KQ78_01572 [Candidatus Izimaplasma bacterium HR2]
MIEIFYRPDISDYNYEYYKSNNILPTFTLKFEKTGVTYRLYENKNKSRTDYFNRRDREYYLDINLSVEDFKLQQVLYSFGSFNLNCGFTKVERVTHLYFILSKYKHIENQTLKFSLNDYQIFINSEQIRPDKIISNIINQIELSIN